MRTLSTVVDDHVLAGHLYPADHLNPRAPLLVALHGGLYTGRYFDVPGSSAGSFAEIANRNGFDLITIDRPGYGDSTLLGEEENTFARQAELLDGAIADLLSSRDDSTGVVLVGHSIGGMIGLEIASRRPGWNLLGISATGMGARIPTHGAAEELGALPLSGVVDVPVPEREKLWYGPEGSYTAAAVEAARHSYAPAPMVELAAAPAWAAARLAAVAAAVDVPVHHALAEFDSLWDSSTDARELFLSSFSDDIRIESEIVPGVGHCLDHHLTGAALHLRQLAFALDCASISHPIDSHRRISTPAL
ncbi:alpha/beta hydrolase [Rhodococcus artemisiae]|uniref:Alpha/beta hydrolase family protein n=1 Tax=Rhodococcus artemisiae TaxID=714159 RepID=A0ABU7L934_9NOCA|nr:alpha/beta hydrolase family protein [Rhodococcus artemisiae]MEE2058055.1 alpha/beta hydrolase family protein [Rhodococcus artemisiae]